ncbi:MAG TPA: hypothetical protein VLM79_34795 [Kofleriaceae bacterium]|nr:hypothetical protein [Kofleriaceae bacterium]
MTARRFAIVVCAVCAACGDNSPAGAELVTAVSGTRLAVQKYRYDDGTELAVGNELYDTELHARCRAQRWIDDTVRCVPVVDEAVYSDAACTELVGLGRTVDKPTLFLAYDHRAGATIAARLFRADVQRAAISQSYAMVDGACTGPMPVSLDGTNFYEIGDELDGSALMALRDGELGDGRLAVQLREADDGLRLPFGVVDRTLGAACAPRFQSDGGMACEPLDAPPAVYFSDPGCSVPAIAVGATVPAIASVVEPSGCARYYRVGHEVSPPVYRRDGAACTAVTAVVGRVFSVDAPLELPALARSPEAVRGHRLQRVILEHDGLRFLDDRLLDTATGVPCSPRTLGDDTRCLPTSVASIGLFTDACTTAVRAAELPRPICEPIAFATTNRPFQLHDLTDPPPGPLFRRDLDGCRLYTGSVGTELRGLGPPLDLTTFVGGVYFGERSP